MIGLVSRLGVGSVSRLARSSEPAGREVSTSAFRLDDCVTMAWEQVVRSLRGLLLDLGLVVVLR
jgi:hypothetical protein